MNQEYKKEQYVCGRPGTEPAGFSVCLEKFLEIIKKKKKKPFHEVLVLK